MFHGKILFFVCRYHVSQVASFIAIRELSKDNSDGSESATKQKVWWAKTVVLHVRFKSWYISLPFSAKQQSEVAKFHVENVNTQRRIFNSVFLPIWFQGKLE